MAKNSQPSASRNGILKSIERVGNALPHPAIIFVILSAVVIVVSYLVSKAGTSVTYYDARAGAEATVTASNLLSADGLR